MRRLIPYAIGLISVLVLAILWIAPGCGSECSRVEDCKPGSVCYRSVCTPVSAGYVKCAKDSDCGMGGEFVCLAPRCVLRTTVVMGQSPDSGPVADASDAGGAADALGGQDAANAADAAGAEDAIGGEDAANSGDGAIASDGGAGMDVLAGADALEPNDGGADGGAGLEVGFLDALTGFPDALTGFPDALVVD
jgi:hypothetical protein